MLRHFALLDVGFHVSRNCLFPVQQWNGRVGVALNVNGIWNGLSEMFSTRFSGQMSQPLLSSIVGSNNQKIRLFAREWMHTQCCNQFRGIEPVKVKKWALQRSLCPEGAMSTMTAFISAITGNEDPLRRIPMDSTQVRLILFLCTRKWRKARKLEIRSLTLSIQCIFPMIFKDASTHHE